MKRVRVIPTLLLDNRKLVKTSRFKSADYIGDPINALKIFNEKEVDEICVLDIAATKNKREPDIEHIKLLTSECFMPLSYGGGVKSIDSARKLFRVGVEKIVFGTVAFKNDKLLATIAQTAGTQSVVVSIDVKNDWLGRPRVFVTNGKENTGITPLTYAKRMEDAGAGELLLQCIDRDGMLSGYDLDLIREVSHSVSIPVVASCGANGLSDFLNAVKAGASAVAAGAMFVYKGSRKAILINYPDQNTLMQEVYSKL